MMDEDAKNTIMAIGSNLYQARRFFGLTMHDVADRTGLCRQTISKAENGDPGLSMETYVLIGKALDVPIMNDMQSSMAEKLPDHPMNRCVGYTRDGQRFVLKKNGETMQICFRYQDTDYAIPMPESRISRRALGTVLYKKCICLLPQARSNYLRSICKPKLSDFYTCRVRALTASRTSCSVRSRQRRSCFCLFVIA